MSDQAGELMIKQGSGASAREISKWSMVVASGWIGVLSLVKAFWSIFVVATPGVPERVFGLSMGDIILSGITLAGVFTPIYLSILVDKVRDIKVGGGA